MRLTAVSVVLLAAIAASNAAALPAKGHPAPTGTHSKSIGASTTTQKSLRTSSTALPTGTPLKSNGKDGPNCPSPDALKKLLDEAEEGVDGQGAGINGQHANKLPGKETSKTGAHQSKPTKAPHPPHSKRLPGLFGKSSSEDGSPQSKKCGGKKKSLGDKFRGWFGKEKSTECKTSDDGNNEHGHGNHASVHSFGHTHKPTSTHDHANGSQHTPDSHSNGGHQGSHSDGTEDHDGGVDNESSGNSEGNPNDDVALGDPDDTDQSSRKQGNSPQTDGTGDDGSESSTIEEDPEAGLYERRVYEIPTTTLVKVAYANKRAPQGHVASDDPPHGANPASSDTSEHGAKPTTPETSQNQHVTRSTGSAGRRDTNGTVALNERAPYPLKNGTESVQGRAEASGKARLKGRAAPTGS